ncbi:hypothetical protein LB531_20880 [Mesorhizobium sp. CO1-1-2]|uniref:hypothetical protein n=1 Tax=Mesorhizobium sp. CO1-1-2 TaxID=2876635 RepID=UPI001CCA8ED6|nr:hypothetical protein [Mesorhizobium sp. CO1-1-2]MBZ9683116.1 hypothetical protein [Mesorhizobium sp. CO1-1-2]
MTVQPATFIPGADVHNPRWTGKRKKIHRCAAVAMFWGDTAKQREEAFAQWRHIAMQVLHEAKVSFRLLALVGEHINMRTGIVSGTNAELAKMGGKCSVSTIQREIGHYENLGLFIGRRSRHSTPDGIIEIRSLRLSLPKTFSPGITMREIEP